jgi:cell division transport system permease protein
MNRFKVVLAEAWRSITASISTTVAATMTVLIGMFLVGLLIALGSWAMSWSDNAKKKLLVKVYLTDSATDTQVNAVREKLESDPRVAPGGVRFISKQEALRKMERQYPELVENLPGNPLPRSFEVKPTKGEYVKPISESLSPRPKGVDKVTYAQKTADRVLDVAKVFTGLSILGIGVLLVAATILIGNTIRLSIFARRREIEVMKLVGASNWFVRGPFVVEGMICALVGSVAAVLLLFLGKELVLPVITSGGERGESSVNAWPFPLISAILVGIGLVLGAAGSGITLRRFLNV